MRVNDQLTASWKESFALFAASVTAGGLTGLLIGTLVALRRRLPDLISVAVAVAGLSLPDFFLVLVGQFISIWTWMHWNAKPWLVLAQPDSLKGWLLPLLVMSLMPMGYMARLTASAMDEVMQEEFIRTARGKGLPEVRVIFDHAFRNALPRILSGLPSLFNLSLSSLPVVERMTNWPGISQWLVINFTPLPAGDLGQVPIGVTPAIVATAGIIFIAWFMLFDGMAHTVRIATVPRAVRQEVVR
jgi:ABC-type dipeptide/oligopeptide/nickel transport system permease component